MKKFLVLLLIPLLVGVIFAANPFQGPLSNLPQTTKLEIQVKLLSLMDQLKITSSQASELANALLNFKRQIKPLQQKRVEELTKLRNALLSSNKDAILNLKKEMEETSKSYFSAVEKFKDSVESVITMKQAKLFREDVKKVIENHTLLSQMFRMFLARRQELMKGEKPTLKAPMPQQRPQNQQKGAPALKRRPNFQKQVPPQKRMEKIERMRKENIIDFIVNSEFYNLLVQTLQMKASATVSK